jgi:hypothetical protein
VLLLPIHWHTQAHKRIHAHRPLSAPFPCILRGKHTRAYMLVLRTNTNKASSAYVRHVKNDDFDSFHADLTD